RAKANASAGKKEFVSMPAPMIICGRIRDTDFSSTQNECPGFITCRSAIPRYLVNPERRTQLVSQVRELCFRRKITGYLYG
ncbi:MAG: hypothetical protein ACXW4Z_21165, partial [Candidatus Binatia bacterium]